MATTLAARSPSLLTELRQISEARDGFDEVYLTAFARAAAPAAAAHDAYGKIGAALANGGIEPIAERVYGTTAARDEILAARRRQLSSRGLGDAPATFLDGAPARGGDFAGIQIWGVRARGGACSVETVRGGRLWRGPSFRALHLASARGDAGAGEELQMRQMFAAAEAGAAAHGFRWAQCVRTWIYVARLLDSYALLNRVRTSCYRRHDFTLPASTGIGARSGAAACVMDALLVDGLRTPAIEGSARQGPAVAYGSAFSRGRVLEWAGGRTVHVSGTASIDASGRSMHAEDPTAQFCETLLDVAAVLAEADTTLRDVAQATLFCKDARAWAACREAMALLGLEDLPAVCVLADVCRPELLVEMEVVAVR